MAKTKTKAATNGKHRLSDLLPSSNGHAEAAPAEASKALTIPPPKFVRLKMRIRGTAPLMQLRFTEKAINTMIAKHEAGSQGNSKKKKEARDFDEDYQQAFHRMPDGTAGFPASALRSACISACRVVGFKMTHAKLSIFVEADGYDVVDATPLVRIHGKPKKTIMPVRNQTGVADLRVRPVWEEWHSDITIRFDSEQFSAEDAMNLVARAGMQVGIGEGRPDSKNSTGLGYGLFEVVNE